MADDRVDTDSLGCPNRVVANGEANEIGITLANLSILKTGNARAIRFSTLASLCAALDCQPGDLLSDAPDDE